MRWEEFNPYDLQSVWDAEHDRFGAPRRELPSLGGAYLGPQPWCRVCREGATRWTYDRYAGGFWGVYVACHGDVCGGLLPPRWDGVRYRIEAFCDEEPHLVGTRLWFVSMSGEECQPAAAVLRHGIERGGAYGGPVGDWARRNASWLLPLPGAIISVLYLWARMHR